MKLALLHEAEIHPDLIPAIEKVNKDFIEKVREAGIGIMSATSTLGPTRETERSRWSYSRSWGNVTQRWLAGYIKMGSGYLSVFIGIDGTIITKYQHRSSENPEHVDPIYENYHKHFVSTEDFIGWINNKLKLFVSKGSSQRFGDFVEKSNNFKVKYNPPPKAKSAEGLDDEDEFERGQDLGTRGIVNSASELSKLTQKGVDIDPRDLAVLFQWGDVRNWLTQSEIDVETPNADSYDWVEVSSIGFSLLDYNGNRKGSVDLPANAATALKRRADRIIKSIMSRIKSILNPKPKTPSVDYVGGTQDIQQLRDPADI